jgi:hypothetical protein
MIKDNLYYISNGNLYFAPEGNVVITIGKRKHGFPKYNLFFKTFQENTDTEKISKNFIIKKDGEISNKMKITLK